MYQTLEPLTAGDSDSPGKWKALRLPDDRWRNASVLDIGCNAGYFCDRARQAGASFVHGIDISDSLIRQANDNFPECVFSHKSWDDHLPKGPFDVVLFLSAMHYESDPVRLLQRVRRVMQPDGVLVLECGVVPRDGDHWSLCSRPGSTVRYPTASLMRSILSDAGFSFRWMGRSVDQKGDSVPRHVYHCQPLRPQVLLTGGPSGIGKSTLIRSLPVRAYAMDDHIRLHAGFDHFQADWLPLARESGLSDLRPFYQLLTEDTELAESFVESFIECLPVADCVAIDCFGGLASLTKHSLLRRGFRVWTVTG